MDMMFRTGSPSLMAGILTLVSVLVGSIPVEFDIRLVGGRAQPTGNLQVYHAGAWGYVCGASWGLPEARVACRQLGYAGALSYSKRSRFGIPALNSRVWIARINCQGDEDSLRKCRRTRWGFNTCRLNSLAGVYCTPYKQTTVIRRVELTHQPTVTEKPSGDQPESQRSMKLVEQATHESPPGRKNPPPKVNSVETEDTAQRNSRPVNGLDLKKLKIRLTGGRNLDEGRVELNFGLKQWGVICSDNWTLLEATTVCKHLGKGYAYSAIQLDHFGGSNLTKMAAGVTCDGDEAKLDECFFKHLHKDPTCSDEKMVAGVICTKNLPDLVPNATLIEESSYLQDRPLYYMDCAMEEGCAAKSAYEIKERQRDWASHRRRLLRFSSSTWNFGTADFKPHLPKSSWKWHSCHRHFHSMEMFAHYDILDAQGDRVAEGHKASFCLEDIRCKKGVQKNFVCKGFGDQGISVGCADDYLHDIDCQWVDMTDVKPGSYTFKVHVNPLNRVAELDYDNNAVHCRMDYLGNTVTMSQCVNGRG